mgnify:CR=1 FL=1
MCLLNYTASKVSDVAHGPPVLGFYFFSDTKFQKIKIKLLKLLFVCQTEGS